MKKIVLAIILSTITIYSKAIEPIPESLKEQMLKTGVYKEGCPVSINNLRLVTVAYKDFKGNLQEGKIVVNSEVASEVVQIFNNLVKFNYPIEKVAPLSNYGSYLAAIKENVTYGFDCRVDLKNPKQWSKHAYGKAIDINPVQNPFVDGANILPQGSSRYTKGNRRHISIVADNRAMLLKTDAPVEVFKSKKWKWGGDFTEYKAYSHFEKELSDDLVVPITQEIKEAPKEVEQNRKVKELFKQIPTEDSGLF